MQLETREPCILRPYIPAEVISTAEAARLAGKTETTIRIWAGQFHLGRLIAGRWAISKVALAMFLAGDHEALAAYLKGDRSSPAVTRYFIESTVPLPSAQVAAGAAA